MNHAAIATAIAALAASTGFLNAAPASADAADPQLAGQHTLGSPAVISESTWTVSDLKPSSDTIAYHPAGRLWEATATDEAARGSATPIVSNFNARVRSGQTYRELFQVPSPEGVNPAGLAQGQKVSGKLYFDVTGDTPDSVTYNAGGPDLALWVQPPPSTTSAGGVGHTTSPAGSATTGPLATPSTTQPAARGGGSAGTVMPAPAQGTPAPSATSGPSSSAGTNAGPAAGTPTPATSAPVPGGPQPNPVAGSNNTQGAPAEPAAPASGGPAAAPPSLPAPTPSPVPAGSEGTSVQPGAGQAPPSSAAPQPATAPAANTAPSPTPVPAS